MQVTTLNGTYAGIFQKSSGWTGMPKPPSCNELRRLRLGRPA